jgi:hypothetical protein
VASLLREMRKRALWAAIGIILTASLLLWRRDSDSGVLNLAPGAFRSSFGFLPDDTLLAVGDSAIPFMDSLRVLQDSGHTIVIVGLNHNGEAPAGEGVNRGLQRAEILRRYMSAYLDPEKLRTSHAAADNDAVLLEEGVPCRLFRLETE